MQPGAAVRGRPRRERHAVKRFSGRRRTVPRASTRRHARGTTAVSDALPPPATGPVPPVGAVGGDDDVPGPASAAGGGAPRQRFHAQARRGADARRHAAPGNPSGRRSVIATSRAPQPVRGAHESGTCAQLQNFPCKPPLLPPFGQPRPVQKSTSESGVFLGKNAAVLAKSRGQREPHRHTIELRAASMAWRS